MTDNIQVNNSGDQKAEMFKTGCFQHLLFIKWVKADLIMNEGFKHHILKISATVSPRIIYTYIVIMFWLLYLFWFDQVFSVVWNLFFRKASTFWIPFVINCAFVHLASKANQVGYKANGKFKYSSGGIFLSQLMSYSVGG